MSEQRLELDHVATACIVAAMAWDGVIRCGMHAAPGSLVGLGVGLFTLALCVRAG